ncbi:MAG: hypothetical protein JF591_03280 [Lysobacter sp.]|nr:hypothetical protein [Lysobacter sp.]
MIAHTTMPYGDALKRSRQQEKILLGAVSALALVVVGAGVWVGRLL